MICFLFSCTPSKNSQQNLSYLLTGKWEHSNPDEILFPEIEFRNYGEAKFNSRADTILFYEYRIKKSYLFLKDRNNVETNNKILKLTKDTLIFETLVLHNGIQVYVRSQ